MKPKDNKNYLAKVVKLNAEGKGIVQLFNLEIQGNVFDFKKLSIKPLELEIAKKEYSIIGLIK
jgi:hypothetical protein